MSQYNIIVSTAEATVVSEYEPQQTRSDAYQSEAALEAAFIKQLTEQGYTYLQIHNSDELVKNLREQLEKLNGYHFRPITKGFMLRSARLLLSSSLPSSR